MCAFISQAEGNSNNHKANLPLNKLFYRIIFLGPAEVNSNENFEEINESLRECPDFQSQVVMLIRQLQPNWLEVVEKYKALCADLRNVLQEIFPGCTVNPFGSTITGLGFKTSDVDIYVNVPKLDRTDNSNGLQYSHATACVNKSKKLLRKYGRLFWNVQAIPRAKTPIIRCVHWPTNTSCDFNFKNMLGVYNSSLISYYMSLDEKLKSVMIIIKYWAKVHDLSGGSGKFSNYALILLLIFYLQHKPYELPSVVSLQDPENCLNPQEGWNGEFTKLENFVSEPLRNQTISEILLGFFDFYVNFDYTLNIICPYLGKVVPKTDFLKPEELPNDFERYKANIVDKPQLKVDSNVCVQDPFEHNHNVSSSVPAKLLEEFVGLCKLGSEIFKDQSDEALYLYRLFTDEIESLDYKKYVWDGDAEFKFKISMGNHLVYLNREVSSNEDVSSDLKQKQSEMRKAWFNLVNKFTEMILTNILKFNVNVEKDYPDSKSQRLNGQNDVHDTDVMNSVSFHCTGVYNLWDARKSISKDINVEESLALIDKQTNITNYICDVLYKGLTLKEVIIELKINLHAKLNPTEMIFHVTKINSKKGYFKSFAAFFVKNIPSWFERYISDLDKSVMQPETENVESKEQEDVLSNKSCEESETTT
ncbi:hypothetical protein ILUMI_08878 [Ignelater luminosus]|uniref:Uncharacterized protein n=1 Tax=Ignelater luminosus TaxID=2038154 RepID=A0A8K0GF17_IGNLU|nr:hypothetical protein ILUMI_08878 [Ignelater luminosus]